MPRLSVQNSRIVLSVADLEARRLARVLLVLRRLAERDELADRGCSAPMRVCPVMTACGPMRVPGADLHVRADDGVRPDLDVRREPRRRSTIAVGWMRVAVGSRSSASRAVHWRRRRCADRAHELGLGRDGVVDARLAVKLPQPARLALERHLERAARRPAMTGLLEARVVDADEVVDQSLVGLVVLGREREDRRGLRHRLDDQHAGHHRVVREMAREIRLVDRHVLQRDDALARLARRARGRSCRNG